MSLNMSLKFTLKVSETDSETESETSSETDSKTDSKTDSETDSKTDSETESEAYFITLKRIDNNVKLLKNLCPCHDLFFHNYLVFHNHLILHNICFLYFFFHSFLQLLIHFIYLSFQLPTNQGAFFYALLESRNRDDGSERSASNPKRKAGQAC